MTVIFKAKTHCAYTIKILAELLQNNIKTACFEIDEDGVKLCMMDHHRTILIQVSLESENFTLYKFKCKDKLFLGINLNHFHKMLKSIKKKDSMQLFINDDSPNDLGIKVIPKENNRITTSFVTIQEIQTIDIDIPEGYGKPIIVPSSEYQKMCKDMAHIGSMINVVARNFHIKFRCNAGGVMKRHVEFGEMGDSDDEEEDDDNVVEYNQDFDTEQLSRITKMAGLSTSMQIYPKQGKPLLFKSAIGSLGKISIYIKSKDLIEKENSVLESDDDDDF
uniref:Proliferating cell nuclear antigen PCNA N-terminal domain-containing protein n=1 Tax=viral metagenome TaxID=1070528 RepID=A0A6C0JTT3_9ZZZZ